ncbi:MAG: amidase [Proteobacteria bacterium]|nr:amidase [Pseudomonadota bacterium]
MNRRELLHAVGALSALGTPAAAIGAAAPGIDVAERSIADLQRDLARGELTSVALTGAYLERIDRLDRAGPSLHAVLAINPDALGAARALDQERRAGRIRGPLHGIPLLIKDNVETADPLPTTAGSRALAASRSPTDAPLVSRLRAAGAVVLGKANLSEWANFRSTHSTSGWSAVGGQTRNAYAPDRSPSGSSAGSAVAAAASLCAAAIGTETNGSILAPASVNGLVGLKPTVGLVSGQGIVPLSPRQDTAGPMARTVADAALLAGVIAERPLGYGRHEPSLGSFRLRGLRVGVLPLPGSAHPEVARLYADARAVFAAEGAVLADLEPPAIMEDLDGAEQEALLTEFKDAINHYLAALAPGRSPARTLADLIAFNRGDSAAELALFGQELFESAETHGGLEAPAYRDALAKLARGADTEGLAALFARDVELLLAPCNGPAERIDSVWGDRSDPGGWPSIANCAAIAGYPSLTVPAGLVRGLPVGLALVAPRDRDGVLLLAAAAYERASHARVPPRLVP